MPCIIFVRDNELVIKIITKGGSLAMRHVSRTRRVALGWLFDTINSDPKIKIKYVDTKNQLARHLTKGSFTRDEWNHLLCLFNIMNNSTFSCGHFSQINDVKPCRRDRYRKEKEEDNMSAWVAKSRRARNLVSMTVNRSPNSAEVKNISKARESYSKLFNIGFI